MVVMEWDAHYPARGCVVVVRARDAHCSARARTLYLTVGVMMITPTDEERLRRLSTTSTTLVPDLCLGARGDFT